MFNPLNLITKFIKSSNQKELDRIGKIVEKINSHEEDFKNLNDDDFPKKTNEFKNQIKDGRTLDKLLPEAFALVREVKEWFDGTILLSGSISDGHSIASSLALGADLAYIGTRFIATKESNADQRYKDMLIESSASDIVYSSLFTGVNGNYLKPSIEKAGLDPDNLPGADKSKMNFGSGGNTKSKAWKDIWGSGQGIGSIKSDPTVQDLVNELTEQYEQAYEEMHEKKTG